MPETANLEEIPVMYVSAPNPKESAGAFNELESKLDVFKGRRFYGVVFDNEYRACVTLRSADEAEMLGLKSFTIPGGRYAKAKITDWSQHLDEICKVFDELAEEFTRDESRPVIEFYRSQKELILFLPIK